MPLLIPFLLLRARIGGTSWLKLFTRIRKVPGSNPGRDRDCPWSPQSLRANYEVALKLDHGSFLSDPFQLTSLVILPSDAMWVELLRVSLNKPQTKQNLPYSLPFFCQSVCTRQLKPRMHKQLNSVIWKILWVCRYLKRKARNKLLKQIFIVARMLARTSFSLHHTFLSVFSAFLYQNQSQSHIATDGISSVGPRYVPQALTVEISLVSTVPLLCRTNLFPRILV
jgi:hypothetical protein